MFDKIQSERRWGPLSKSRWWVPEKNDVVTDVCNRCFIGGISEFERDKREVEVMREKNGGGCDRPRPFRVIAIWAGVVLAKCLGGTVTSAQISSGIGIMHLCWGL